MLNTLGTGYYQIFLKALIVYFNLEPNEAG